MECEVAQCYFRYRNAMVGRFSVSFVWGLQVFSRHFMRIALDAVRMFFRARMELCSPKLTSEAAGMTLGQWLDVRSFSSEFKHHFLLPAMAAICTCCYDSAAAYPADIVLRYLMDRSHVGVMRAANGTSDVAHNLSKAVHEVKVGSCFSLMVLAVTTHTEFCSVCAKHN
jgi:predicted NAD/FAD-binding protein